MQQAAFLIFPVDDLGQISVRPFCNGFIAASFMMVSLLAAMMVGAFAAAFVAFLQS